MHEYNIAKCSKELVRHFPLDLCCISTPASDACCKAHVHAEEGGDAAGCAVAHVRRKQDCDGGNCGGMGKRERVCGKAEMGLKTIKNKVGGHECE